MLDHDHVAGHQAAPIPQLPRLHDDDAARSLAQLWYSEHMAEHLSCDTDMAVKRCAAFLLGEGIAAPRAHTLALQALGSMQQRDCLAFIDIDRSTSHVVFLVDTETKREFAYTAAQLAQLSRTSHDSAPVATPMHNTPEATGYRWSRGQR